MAKKGDREVGKAQELLELCGHSPALMKRELPRLEKTLSRLDVSESDIGRAIQKVNRYFDMGSEGVRTLVGLHLETLCDTVLAKEEGAEKVIYSDWPHPVPPLIAAKNTAPEVFITTPAQIINCTMGMFFDKLGPITEGGEEVGLAPGRAHCPLYQTHVGAIAKGLIPMPDYELVGCFFCDVPASSIQLLHELYGVPVFYTDGCPDAQWGQWPELNIRQTEYVGNKIAELTELLEREIGRSISEEVKHRSITDYAKLFYSVEDLYELTLHADPQPISQAAISLGLWLINTPLTWEQYDRATAALSSLIREVKEKMEKGEGICPKGSPRVFFTIIMSVDPAPVVMLEEMGVNVPLLFWNYVPQEVRFKWYGRHYADRVAGQNVRIGLVDGASALIEYHNIYQRDHKFDGQVIIFATSCRVYSMTPLMMKNEMKKIGVPSMVLEGEFYDTRNYSAEQMRTRLETFVQMLKLRKNLKTAG